MTFVSVISGFVVISLSHLFDTIHLFYLFIFSHMLLFLRFYLNVCECGQNQSIENEKKKTIIKRKEEIRISMDYEHGSISACK